MKLSNFFAMSVVTLASTVSLAYPMVGDKAEWEGTYTKDPDAAQTLVVKKEVTEHDDTDKEWMVKVDKIINGVTTTMMEDIDDDKMYSTEKWNEIMTNCEAKKGMLEDVTVPAGTFKTCHMKKTCDGHSWEVWWGDVPFGVVKGNWDDTEKGEHHAVELKTFTLGQ